MREIREKFDKQELLVLINELEKKGILDEEEKSYLFRKINGLYDS